MSHSRIIPAIVRKAVHPRLPPEMLPGFVNKTEVRLVSQALFTISPDGTSTVDVKVSTGDARLDKLALDAARLWEFTPAYLNGEPTECRLNMQIHFHL